MLPLSDAIPFGSNLFIQFPYLKFLMLPAIPIFLLERGIPFGSFILFLILFFSIVRNNNLSYFLRFNTLQALLINIGIILLVYCFEILLAPLGASLISKTFASTIFIAILTLIIFSIAECSQGREPDIPGISEAVKIQL